MAAVCREFLRALGTRVQGIDCASGNQRIPNKHLSLSLSLSLSLFLSLSLSFSPSLSLSHPLSSAWAQCYRRYAEVGHREGLELADIQQDLAHKVAFAVRVLVPARVCPASGRHRRGVASPQLACSSLPGLPQRDFKLRVWSVGDVDEERLAPGRVLRGCTPGLERGSFVVPAGARARGRAGARVPCHSSAGLARQAASSKHGRRDRNGKETWTASARGGASSRVHPGRGPRSRQAARPTEHSPLRSRLL